MHNYMQDMNFNVMANNQNRTKNRDFSLTIPKPRLLQDVTVTEP